MSVERMNTVLSFTTQGVEQVVNQIRQIARAMEDATQTRTPLAQISPGNAEYLRSQAPRAFNEIESLRAKQGAAELRLAEATDKVTNLRKKKGEDDAAFNARTQRAAAAELSALAAVNTARANLATGYKRLADELAGSAAAESLERQRRAALQKQVVDDANATTRATESLNRQRNTALQKQVMDDARDTERARDSLNRQRNTALQKQVMDEARLSERAVSSLERQRSTALQKQVMDEARATERASKSLERQRNTALQRQVVNEARETERASKALEAQRNRALQKQVMDDAKESERASKSLERQRSTALAKQADLEHREAEEAARRAKIALSPGEISNLVASPVRQPGDSDRVYRARELLADAEMARANANSRYTEAIRRAEHGEGRSRTELIEGVRRATIAYDASSRGVTDAQRRLQMAIDNQALAHARAQQRSFREEFVSGFRGRRDASYGEQLGQAFKFSVFYGTAYKLLFGLTATLAATLQEGIAFQQGMTDLAIATGRPKDELNQIADELGRSAVRAGFAPSQGVEIGARSLGLYGATDASAGEQDRVMRISSEIVNQLAVGAKKAPVELQGDIASIAQALGLGAQGQFRIADLDAYMTKKFGIQQGSTLETVAQSASVGKAAGFSDEQLFAIAADMISRTGQTPSAVAGYMAQIFSRGGEGSLVDVARKQGIDPNQELASIVRELAMIYQTAAPREQAEISAAFGRGKIQNAAVALLGDYDEVLMRSTAALSDATGQAGDVFKVRMDNIGGQIAQLQGVLRDFASQLGESGVLDILGLGIVTLREFLEAMNGVLRLWNMLPNAIQDTLIALVLLRAALRSTAATSALSSLLNRGGQAGALGQFRRTAGGAPVYVNPAGQASRLMSGAGMAGLAAAGKSALGMIGPIGLAIGGLMAIGSLKNSADRLGAAQRAAAETLAQPGVGVGASSSQFQAYGGELASLAKQNREAAGWFATLMTGGTADNQADANAARLEAEAKRIEAVAKRVARDEREVQQSGNIRSLGAADLTAGLDAMEAEGANAADQLSALRDVLWSTSDAARAAREAFDPKTFAGQFASDLLPVVSDALKEAVQNSTVTPRSRRDDAGGIIGGINVPRELDRDEINRSVAENLSGRDAQKAIRNALRQHRIKSGNQLLDEGTATRVAETIGEGWAEQVMGPFTSDPAVIAEVQEKINQFILHSVIEKARLLARRNQKMMSPSGALSAVEIEISKSEERLDALPSTDVGGRKAELESRIRDIRAYIRRSQRAPGTRIIEYLQEARRELAQTQFEELEDMRRAAMQNATSKAEIIRIGRRFMRREIRAAVRGGNTETLIEIIGQAGKGSIAIARSSIRGAIQVARKAIEAGIEVLRAADAMGPFVAGHVAEQIKLLEDMGMEVPKELQDALETQRNVRRWMNRLAELKEMEEGLDRTDYGGPDKNVYRPSGADYYNPILEEDEKDKDKDSPAAIAAARAAAYAAKSGGQMAAARAAIMSARASIADAKKNTVDYWNAMGELWSAQNQMTEAVLAYKSNLGLLRIDITNPLAEARHALRDARAKLLSDRRTGKDKDVIAQDRVDVRRAQANAEATAFSQRLQSVQTAEELGRISHSKYLKYLNNEKDRLERIKNRTFQQQDQLDQIDRLLKDAASQMEAQWNLGDIKLPTPYQVRRYIEQQSGAREARLATTARSTTVQNNTFTINGADTGKVKKIIEDTVGKPTKVRTAQPRRR